MSHKKEADTSRKHRQRRVRRKIRGSAERPRLCVYRSLKHIYAQVIDDSTGAVVASASSLESAFNKPEPPAAKSEAKPEADEKKSDKKKGKAAAPKGSKILCSEEVGRMIAGRIKEKGIEKVVFDRNGFLYHGRIKAVADAARKAGLQF